MHDSPQCVLGHSDLQNREASCHDFPRLDPGGAQSAEEDQQVSFQLETGKETGSCEPQGQASNPAPHVENAEWVGHAWNGLRGRDEKLPPTGSGGSANLLTGWSRVPGSFRHENMTVSFTTLSFLVRPPTIVEQDQGKGYEDWLRADPLQGWEIPAVVARCLAQKLAIAAIACVPAGVLCYCFSLLVTETVKEWRQQGVSILQDSPLIAGIIGEPFHELKPSLLYSTFGALQILCPILCCQTKIIGQLVMMHGRKLLPVWRVSVASGVSIMVMHWVSAIVMHSTGRRIPRLAWMAMIFVSLFLGLFLAARVASRILDVPGFTFQFFRAAFVSNVLLYLYAVFYPFWFFSTDSLLLKGAMAIVITPSVEYGVYFLHQHTAIHYEKNDPKKAVYPGVHYSLLFGLYGTFLLVNFPEPWHNIVSLALVRLFGVVCQVFAQEVTYLTYRFILGFSAQDCVELLRTLRFKAFKHNMINLQTIQRCFVIVVAGMVTYWHKFDTSSRDNSDVLHAPGAGRTASVVAIQVGITVACAAITDVGLAVRQTKWHSAWEQRDELSSLKLGWLYFASTGMFLFYFFPFLALRMILPEDLKQAEEQN